MGYLQRVLSRTLHEVDIQVIFRLGLIYMGLFASVLYNKWGPKNQYSAEDFMIDLFFYLLSCLVVKEHFGMDIFC